MLLLITKRNGKCLLKENEITEVSTPNNEKKKLKQHHVPTDMMYQREHDVICVMVLLHMDNLEPNGEKAVDEYKLRYSCHIAGL